MTVVGSGLGMWSFVRVVVSLGIVVTLMVVAMRVLRRNGPALAPRGTRKSSATLELVAKQTLSRSATVALLRIGSRLFLIGIGDSQVNLLSEGDRGVFGIAEDEPDQDADVVISGTRRAPDWSHRSDSAWKTLLDAIRERTVRRV
jgi:flagellar biogenesis protein FliO